jgi:hypothetical protein
VPAKRVLAPLLLLLLALLSAGCSTVLFVRNERSRIFTPAIYETRRPFYFFGLAGQDQDVYLDRICLGKDVDQVSTEYTGGDVLVSLVTLGIYTPRTLKIWCQL